MIYTFASNFGVTKEALRKYPLKFDVVRGGFSVTARGFPDLPEHAIAKIRCKVGPLRPPLCTSAPM